VGVEGSPKSRSGAVPVPFTTSRKLGLSQQLRLQ
jgi:hypothetical protein